MEKKISNKTILLGLSLFMIITLSIAFASLAIRLKVEGSVRQIRLTGISTLLIFLVQK